MNTLAAIFSLLLLACIVTGVMLIPGPGDTWRQWKKVLANIGLFWVLFLVTAMVAMTPKIVV